METLYFCDFSGPPVPSRPLDPPMNLVAIKTMCVLNCLHQERQLLVSEFIGNLSVREKIAKQMLFFF